MRVSHYIQVERELNKCLLVFLVGVLLLFLIIIARTLHVVEEH